MEESWTFYRSALPPLFLSVTVVIGLLILVGNILLLLTFKRMPRIKTMHACVHDWTRCCRFADGSVVQCKHGDHWSRRYLDVR